MRACVQFTSTAGSGTDNILQILVRDRFSNAVPLLYIPPTITGMSLVSGSKNDSVVLQITGTDFGLACSSCVAATQAVPLCASASTSTSVSCDTLACAGGDRVPVIAINSSTTTVRCIPQCVVKSTGSASSITCRTASPIALGDVVVTVGGLSSPRYGYAYEQLLPTPTLMGAPAPQGAPSTGTRLSVSGSNLGSSGDVVLNNDMGEVIILASPYNATYFEVRGVVEAALLHGAMNVWVCVCGRGRGRVGSLTSQRLPSHTRRLRCCGLMLRAAFHRGQSMLHVF